MHQPPALAHTEPSPFTELRQHWRILLAATLGWMLDAFDFSVLLFLIHKLSHVFHVSLAAMALVATGTLLAKVVGNTAWGVWADRHGRKLPFIVGICWFAVFCGLSGLSWSYASFLAFRVLFGIGYAGEWSAGAPLLMESITGRAKGLASGIMMAGYEAGYLLAALAFATVYPALGWRWMFFLGFIPALLALFVAKSVKESPVRRTSPGKRRIPMTGATVQAWGFMGAINFLSYAVYSIYPTFLTIDRHFSPGQVFPLVAAYSVASIAGKPLAGQLSQRFGQRRLAVVYMALTIPSILPYVFSSSAIGMFAGAALMGLLANGIFGIVPSYLADRFPAASRSAGMGTGYAIAGITGGIAPYIVALLTPRTGIAISMAFFIAVGAVASALAVAFRTRTLAVDDSPAPASTPAVRSTE